MSGENDLLKRLYRIFSPAPLGADQQNLYVDLEAVRGNTGLVKSLADPILLADKPTCQLLTGHMGSGKSTELRQLKKHLNDTKNPPFVVICDISEDLNPADLDFPDLLVMILKGLAVELEKLKISLQPGLFEQRLSWINEHLRLGIKLTGVTLKAGIVEIAGALQHSPDTKKKIRDLIDPETVSWIDAANDIIGVAKLKLSKKGYNDIVILVDGLDKMSRDTHPKAGCNVGEHLYIDRKKDLSSLDCHVVYSIPLYLAYSSVANKITSLYGITDIPVVPVTKVRHRPPNSDPYDRGIEQLREIVRLRLDDISVTAKDVFEDGALDRLIRLSGGQLRELMVFIRDAAATKLPINDAAIDRVEGNVRRVYARWIEQKHWTVIEEVRKTGKFTRHDKNADEIEQLLDSRAILHYRNTEEWYGANPLLPKTPPEPTA